MHMDWGAKKDTNSQKGTKQVEEVEKANTDNRQEHLLNRRVDIQSA